MNYESILRPDLADPALLVDSESVKFIVQQQFDGWVEEVSRFKSRTVSPAPSKNIIEVQSLIRQAILDRQAQEATTPDAEIDVTYDDPDSDVDGEVISICLQERVPGMFAQGKPGANAIKNRKPILREMVDDPDNPGYKRAVLGFFYDNILRLTCWARTNKAASARALWLEDLMEDYSWFFAYSGVNRMLFQKQEKDETINVSNNKYHGRPIDFFVRTEKLRSVSQKTLEEICFRLVAKTTE